VLEVEGAERRLDERREDVAVPREAVEFAARQRAETFGEPAAEPEQAGDLRAARPADDVRPRLGQPSFGELREAVVELLSDCEVENRVPEELEPLVRGRAVLDRGGMGEGARAKLWPQPLDQPKELAGIGVGRRVSFERRCSRLPARPS
jgi:hypothetical protein